MPSNLVLKCIHLLAVLAKKPGPLLPQTRIWLHIRPSQLLKIPSLSYVEVVTIHTLLRNFSSPVFSGHQGNIILPALLPIHI